MNFNCLDSATIIVTAVSPVKRATKSNYFDATLTDSSGTMRVVGFNIQQHLLDELQIINTVKLLLQIKHPLVNLYYGINIFNHLNLE